MTPVRALAVASVAAGLLLAAGCTGMSDPSPSTTSIGASSTSSPSPTPPATPSVPAAARAHTEAGAEAFVRFYIDQLNLAWTRPSDAVLPPLSHPDCVSCKNMQSTAEDLAAHSQHYRSNPVAVVTAASFPGAPSGQQFVRLLLDQQEVDVVDESGKVMLTDQSKKLTRTVVVIWEGGAWLLYGFAE